MKEEEIKKQIAEILRTDIHYSAQVGTYVIHGAIENIYKLFTEWQAAQLQSAPAINTQEIVNKLYKTFGTDSGILFGISERAVVNSIVDLTLEYAAQSAPKAVSAEEVLKQIFSKTTGREAIEEQWKEYLGKDSIQLCLAAMEEYAAQSAPKQVEEIAALKSTIKSYGELNARLCNDVVAEKDKHIAYVEQAHKDYDALWNKLQDAQSAPKQSAGVWDYIKESILKFEKDTGCRPRVELKVWEGDNEQGGLAVKIDVFVNN